MIKLNGMNVFECLTIVDQNLVIMVLLSNGVVIQGCPDDVLRKLTYEEAGEKVSSMGFCLDEKYVTFSCK